MKREIKATSIVGMEVEQALGKIRETHVCGDKEEYAVPCSAARLPVQTMRGEMEEYPRQTLGVAKPAEVAGYVAELING